MTFTPKLIHLSWVDKTILESECDLVQNGVRALVRLNPEWEVEVSTNDEINEYLCKWMSSQDFSLIEHDGIVPKTDIWRLFKMYLEGGVYVDVDRYCNLGFAEILESQTTCVLPTCLDSGFSQDFMMSAPNNPIYLEALNLLLERRKSTSNVYFLGPQTYMHAVTKCLTGEMIDVNPGVETFERIRKTISQFPFIQTYREYLPYNSVTYRGQDNGQQWEMEKRALYRSYGLKHWTGEW